MYSSTRRALDLLTLLSRQVEGEKSLPQGVRILFRNQNMVVSHTQIRLNIIFRSKKSQIYLATEQTVIKKCEHLMILKMSNTKLNSSDRLGFVKTISAHGFASRFHRKQTAIPGHHGETGLSSGRERLRLFQQSSLHDRENMVAFVSQSNGNGDLPFKKMAHTAHRESKSKKEISFLLNNENEVR